MNNTLTFSSKVELTENSLTFTSAPTEEDIATTFKTLSLAEGATLFWIGDFLNQVEIIKGKTYAEICAKSNYAPDTLWKAKRVCAAIRPEKRVRGLTYSFHKEVLELTKDPAKTVELLIEAKEQGLKLSQIRKNFRLSNAETAKEDVEPIAINNQYLTLINALDTIKHIFNGTPQLAADQKSYLMNEIESVYQLAREQLN